MRVLRFLLPLLILGAAAWGYQQVRSSGSEGPAQAPPSATVPLVSADPVRFVRAVPNIRLYGTVETPALGSLTSAVEADVLAVHALKGDRVEKGTLLVRLDGADIRLRQLQHEAELQEIDAQIESDRIRYETDRASLEAEENLLALIGRSVERAQTLVKSQAGAQSAVDAALQDEQRQQLAIIQRQRSIREFPSRQQQLKARRARIVSVLRQTERDLAHTEILAPFDGRITETMVAAGDRVSRGGRILHLYDESALELRVQVPDSVIPVFQQALDAGARIAGRTTYNGRTIALQLDRLAALVSSGKGGLDTFFRTAGDTLPTLGTILDVVVDLPAVADAVVLPPDALYDRDRVYVIDDDTLVARQVRFLGTRSSGTGGHRVILDGRDFSAGERVMRTRLPRVVSGMKVQVEAR